MNLGESISQTVVREVEEETGLRVEPTRLVGIYTDPDHIIEYSDGEVRQQFNVCYTARVIGGSLAISNESTALRFVAIEELDSVPIHESTKMRIDRFIARIPTPHLG